MTHTPLLMTAQALALGLACLCATAILAAPDEDALGKAAGYPVAPKLGQAYQEPYRVGSFSAMDSLSSHCVVEPATDPLALPMAKQEPSFRYNFDGKTLSLDDYMQRQRATALLVVKDGQIVAQRSAYDRTPEARLLSNSMAKTIVALAIGTALESGYIRSIDDTADSHEPKLADTLYGQTSMVDPKLKLVVVHMAVAKDAAGNASGTNMGAERDAMWRGIVARYGNW
jgi:CubicO group peptidase (beta-lactamase class C family)